MTKLLSFTLCSNWDAELVRLKVLSADGPEALAALDADYPAWQPVIAPVGEQAGRGRRIACATTWRRSSAARSAGGRIEQLGRGRLAHRHGPADPGQRPPPRREPAGALVSRRRPHAAGGATAGATFVGGPSVLVGHNGTACWGMTAGLVDNTDLFLEEIGPDGASVRQGDGFVPCEVREEVIAVKGGAAVTERVLVTPRGPIVSPALGDAPAGAVAAGNVAGPAAHRGAVSHQRMSRASRSSAPPSTTGRSSSQNMAYADTSGTIGWQLIGRAPIRKKGHGAMPLSGLGHGSGLAGGRECRSRRCPTSRTRSAATWRRRTIATIRRGTGRSWAWTSPTAIG